VGAVILNLRRGGVAGSSYFAQGDRASSAVLDSSVVIGFLDTDDAPRHAAELLATSRSLKMPDALILAD
jgi:hypothetical protein